MMHTSQMHGSEAPAHTFMEQGRQLLQLVFWLTGDPAATMDALVEATDVQDAAHPFFPVWMEVWKRKLVIAKALRAVHSQMAVSIRRTKMHSAEISPQRDSLPPPSWSAGHQVSSTHLENALFAIDLFPRCAFLLLIFEKLPLDDVAILLNTNKELVKKAEEIALTELARNIALEQGWAAQSAANASWPGRNETTRK